jgi:phage nucleotide-binding protein
MAIKLTSTKNTAQVNINVLVAGLAGAGKTSLIGTINEPTLIISAEAGLLPLRHLDIPVVEVKTLEDVKDAYRFVTESAEAKDFQWIALDSISEIAEVVLANEKKVSKDPRQAYGQLAESMTELIRAFRDMPRNVYFSCKLERVKDEATGSMLYAPSMPGAKLGQAIPYFFDEVFALRVERDNEGKQMRVLQTQSDFQYIAKDRSGCLEMFEAPDLSAIVNKVRSTATN